MGLAIHSRIMLIAIFLGEQSSNIIELLEKDIPSGVELISCESADHMPREEEVEAVIGYWVPTGSIPPKLRWICWPNAGVEDVPEPIWKNRQWELTHGGGPGAVSISEWTITSMLFFAHRFRDILRYESERAWHSNRVKDMTAGVLRNATVGILGYGAIGREVARLCKAFGMQVHASLGVHGRRQVPTYRTPGTGDPDGVLPDQWFKREEFGERLPEWDYLVLGLRVTARTRYIIDSETLQCCKPSAVLINPARGELIDETALAEALEKGRLGGAALDVFETEPLPADSPLRDAPNILISPHCSPESLFYRQEVLEGFKENIKRFAAGDPLFNVVIRDAG